MKDTKTVLPTVNGNGENKNGFHSKHKHSVMKHDNDEHHSAAPMTSRTNPDSEELVGGCCVCSDDQGFANNALVYCDGKGCTVACHTACYGIVSIPDGDWYCGRCEAGNLRAPCRLCPTIEGAMKRTSDNGWAHVVCALYIPEVSFGDDATMEPIVLSKIPPTRFGQECSICSQNGRSKLISSSGACCSCTVKNCSQVFHVTCAQANGLLCEDVRKNNCQYPIYCEQHRPKLSKFIRQIPAFPYSPNSLASAEQLTRQQLLVRKKESPSQLSDFVTDTAVEADPGEANPPLTTSSTLDESNNQSTTSDEQQTPVARAFHAVDVLPRKSSSNANTSLSSSSSISPLAQPKSHSRSSSTSSSSNSSVQKKAKLTDDTTQQNQPSNQSLNDLSQFVQLNKEERSFLPPPPPRPTPNLDKEGASKADSGKTEIRETTGDSSKAPPAKLDQPASLSSLEEKSLASRCSVSSSNDPNLKMTIKQSRSTDASSTSGKATSFKKTSTGHQKDDEEDDDFQVGKKRKLSIKLSKDGQPRKPRPHSTEGAGPRPVGRPPSKKNQLTQQLTNGLKRPVPKTTTNHNNNMKRSKINDTLITMQQNPSDVDHEHDTKAHARSTTYYPCDHFGNQINSDVYQQHVHGHEPMPPADTSSDTAASRVPASTARIDFYPRRPLQDAAAASTTAEAQQQRTFPPQTLEEFLEQEWELSSDFLLQQTMPHDVSSLLSCLYQFKSENAALQKKFDELRHRRDSLRVTNANLRRRLAEVLPINETIPAATTATITQVSPPVPHPPLPPTTASIVLPVVPASPRKEQQQLKQQKLLAELELQQQLQQQKAISPTRRRLSTNTTSAHPESSQPTIKKSKSPRQINALSHASLLENQLRQSALSNSMKKLNATPPASSTNPKKLSLTTSEMELVSHHQPLPPTASALPPPVLSSISASSSSTSPFEQIEVGAAAATAYALSKNARTTSNPGLSLELISQILAASGNQIGPQLFAPTWNISNFGMLNFRGTNPMSISDDSILRSYASPTHPPLEQQPSTKPQP